VSNASPAFILRFVDGLTKNGRRMLTVWNAQDNILCVDRELHDSHERLDQIVITRSYRDIGAGERFRA